MLKKTITYTDYNGYERTEDFYFNFNESELTDMQLTTEGGLDQFIQKIIDTKDMPNLIRLFKELVLKAYGEKSADGKRFVKIDKDGYRLANDFAQTEAFNKLYMELVQDDVAAANFFKAVVPPAKNTNNPPVKNN